jgi:transcription elongation factor Elf1
MKCPKCNKEFTERPALSREDNKTNICPQCGIKEALEALVPLKTLYAVIVDELQEAAQNIVGKRFSEDVMDDYVKFWVSHDDMPVENVIQQAIEDDKREDKDEDIFE